MLTVLDLFSCVGCHAEGLHAAGGFETTQFVEIDPFRRAWLAQTFPGVPAHDDVRTFLPGNTRFDCVVGGPPCQRTSVASAIHGYRTGDTLWPEQFRVTNDVRPEWVVVEQPAGSVEWEANVSNDLARIGYHTARSEFAASDLGAPHPRRRVFILANRSLSRLAIAWQRIPSEIARIAGLGADGNPWASPFGGLLGVDAGNEKGAARRRLIEAIGDSNPPAMMEVIGRSILASVEHG